MQVSGQLLDLTVLFPAPIEQMAQVGVDVVVK
jgi:hypothetical protein